MDKQYDPPVHLT